MTDEQKAPAEYAEPLTIFEYFDGNYEASARIGDQKFEAAHPSELVAAGRFATALARAVASRDPTVDPKPDAAPEVLIEMYRVEGGRLFRAYTQIGTTRYTAVAATDWRAIRNLAEHLAQRLAAVSQEQD